MQQTDPQFVDNYVAAIQDEPSADDHEQWVNEKLAQDFMRNTAVAFRFGFVVMVLTAVLLLGYVATEILVVWILAYSLCLGYRHYVVIQFDALMLQQANRPVAADLTAFFKRHTWSWAVGACVFASPVFFYYDKTSPTHTYLCLMILAGMGTLASSLMSANLACQRSFAHALSATVLMAILVSGFSHEPVVYKRESLVLLLLVVLFWFVVLYLGKHLHHLQRSNYSAQFGNEQLIRSLRQQTMAATVAVQTKNNLLASAAHDLRQPVHALAFYADWLRNEPDLASSVIPKILAATDSVNTLFNSLFDFARLEAGAIQVNLGDVDIHALIEEMAVQFAPAADEKGLSLQINAVEATVYSDPVLLRRITSNLLANAIRYTDKGGVMLSARVVGHKLWLEISDSGQGISPEHLPHVFKEFYRAPVHQGTADSFGLGLAIVQRLCRALGHVVTLRSVLGKGTRCRLEVKLSKTDQQFVASDAVPLDHDPDKANSNNAA